MQLELNDRSFYFILCVLANVNINSETATLVVLRIFTSFNFTRIRKYPNRFIVATYRDKELNKFNNYNIVFRLDKYILIIV